MTPRARGRRLADLRTTTEALRPEMFMADSFVIPTYVADALRVWHAAAIEYDPLNPSTVASERAVAAWRSFEGACLNWEAVGRANKKQRGPT